MFWLSTIRIENTNMCQEAQGPRHSAWTNATWPTLQRCWISNIYCQYFDWFRICLCMKGRNQLVQISLSPGAREMLFSLSKNDLYLSTKVCALCGHLWWKPCSTATFSKKTPSRLHFRGRNGIICMRWWKLYIPPTTKAWIVSSRSFDKILHKCTQKKFCAWLFKVT